MTESQFFNKLLEAKLGERGLHKAGMVMKVGVNHYIEILRRKKRSSG